MEFIKKHKKFIFVIIWLIVVVGIFIGIMFGTLNYVGNKKEVKLKDYSVKTIKEVIGKKAVDSFSKKTSKSASVENIQYVIMYKQNEISIEEIEKYEQFFIDEGYEVVEEFEKNESRYQMVYQDATVGIQFVYANKILKVNYYYMSK